MTVSELLHTLMSLPRQAQIFLEDYDDPSVYRMAASSATLASSWYDDNEDDKFDVVVLRPNRK